MNANAEAKWLDAEVVVQLANAADILGGVGAYMFESGGCPVCLYGIAAAIDGVEGMDPVANVAFYGHEATTPVLKAIRDAGIDYEESDAAVRRLLGSIDGRRDAEYRATDFEAYLAELGVRIRGVDDEPVEAAPENGEGADLR